MTFEYTSDTIKVSACLKRGVKWYVDRFAVGSCAAPVVVPTKPDTDARD